MKKIFYFVFVITLLAVKPLASQPYTLQDCRQMALENNARIQDMKLGEQISLQMKKQALTYFFPNVSAFGMGFQASNPMMSIDMGMLGSMELLKDGLRPSNRYSWVERFFIPQNWPIWV